MEPPVALPSKVYSPSARQPTLAELAQRVAPATPFSKRGSKAQAAFAAVDGPLNVVELPPPSGLNTSVGVTGALPRFCTTIVGAGEADVVRPLRGVWTKDLRAARRYPIGAVGERSSDRRV